MADQTVGSPEDALQRFQEVYDMIFPAKKTTGADKNIAAAVREITNTSSQALNDIISGFIASNGDTEKLHELLGMRVIDRIDDPANIAKALVTLALSVPVQTIEG